jgi:hypothetical protein
MSNWAIMRLLAGIATSVTVVVQSWSEWGKYLFRNHPKNVFMTGYLTVLITNGTNGRTLAPALQVQV